MASESKIVLITGANTGLGFEAVKALCKSSVSYNILVGSRNKAKGEAAIDALKTEFPQTASKFIPITVDVTSDESIEKAAEVVSAQFGKVDILVNNAGTNFDRNFEDGSLSLRQAWNASWDTNVSGAMVMTHTFVPLLLKSSDPRLLFVTSGASSLAETEFTESAIHARLNASPVAGWPKVGQFAAMSYRSAKTGLNMVMRQWHRLLKNDGVKTWALSPGFLATGLGGPNMPPDMMRKMGAEEPYLGGEFIRDVIEGKRDQDDGKAIRRDTLQAW